MRTMGLVRKARVIRRAKGLSLSDVARETGIGKDRLSRFERGTGLDVNAMLVLARFYGVHVEDLLECVATDGREQEDNDGAEPKAGG